MSITRTRFTGSYGSPIRRTIVGSSTSTTSSGNAKAVDELTQALKYLQDQEALQKLSQGDADTFIAYATMRLNELTAGDPNIKVWQDLIAKAKQKQIEDTWAADIQSGKKTLEQFLSYLKDEYSSAPAGSSQAASILKTIDSTQKAITARDESKQDQTALLQYIDTQDHQAYQDYLKQKLARTTDPTVQKTLLQQISDLQTRINSQEQVKRAQQVSDIIDNYKSGSWTATQAIQALHDLAQNGKNITASEVGSIQSVVNSIFSSEEDKMKSARAAGSAAAASGAKQMVDDAIAGFTAAQAKINAKISLGQQVTEQDLNDLHSAQAVLQNAYQLGIQNTTSQSDRFTWQKDSANLVSDVAKTEASVDKAAINGIDLSATGKSAFEALLGKGSDPTVLQGNIDLINQRILDLGYGINSVMTPGGKRVVQDAMQQLVGQESNAIKTLANTKSKAGADAAVAQAWVAYQKQHGDLTKTDFEDMLKGAAQSGLNFSQFKTLIGQNNFSLTGEAQKSSGTGHTGNVGDLLGGALGFLGGGNKSTPSPTTDPNEQLWANLVDAVQNGGNDPQARDMARKAALEFVNNPYTQNFTDESIFQLALAGSVMDTAFGQTPDWLAQQIYTRGQANANKAHSAARDPFATEDANITGGMSAAAPIQQSSKGPGMASVTGDQYGGPSDAQLSLHDSGGARDPFAAADAYLNSQTQLDLPGFTTPDLPANDPYQQMTFNWNVGGSGDSPFDLPDFTPPQSSDAGYQAAVGSVHSAGGARDPFAGES